MGAVTREFLKKLELQPNEIALVDMEAGIEHFGRGIENHVDMVLTVVEPSLESITLAKKVMDLTQAAGATFKGAILNKISSPEQLKNMNSKLNAQGVPVAGVINYHQEIQDACLEGQSIDTGPVSEEIKRITGELLNGS
jgi:CO dehydrogenase maturation factor